MHAHSNKLEQQHFTRFRSVRLDVSVRDGVVLIDKASPNLPTPH